LRSEGYRLNVSLLKIQQRTIALESSHRSTLSMLASYIGIPIGDDTQLVKPVIPNNLAGEIKRPELYFYDYHIEKYNIQNKLLNKKVIPRLSFFAQGGYGRPTLNLLSNDFSSYYLAGLQLKWSLSEFYTLGKEKETNTIQQQQQIASQRESFLFDVQREIDDRDRAIVQYQKQLETDDAIIEMQRLIKKTSLIKLTNGTIDAN